MSDDAPVIFPHVPVEGYELLDCGAGEKLERVGGYVLRRPDPQAMWRPALGADAWDAADLRFVRESDRGGRWEPGPRAGRRVPDAWELRHGGACLVVRPTPFKHVGLFPEQSANWAWTAERLAACRAAARRGDDGGERPAVLNLFAYTGAATVMATLAGAFVTHVDASRPALRWAKENAARTGLPADAVRWIEDDVPRFVARERRRGRRYRGILLDPPPYGRGPSNERWVFEERVAELLTDCAGLLEEEGPAFLVLSCYAVGTSPLAFRNLLGDVGPGRVQAGELALPGAGGRLLPAGLCGRWWREAGPGRGPGSGGGT